MHRETNARRFVKGVSSTRDRSSNKSRSPISRTEAAAKNRSKSNKKKDRTAVKSKSIKSKTNYQTKNESKKRNNSYLKKYAMQNSNRSIVGHRPKSSKNSDKSIRSRKPKKSTNKGKTGKKNKNSKNVKKVQDVKIDNQRKSNNIKKFIHNNDRSRVPNPVELSKISEEKSERFTLLESRNGKISNVFKISAIHNNSFVPDALKTPHNQNLIKDMAIPQSPSNSVQMVKSQSGIKLKNTNNIVRRSQTNYYKKDSLTVEEKPEIPKPMTLKKEPIQEDKLEINVEVNQHYDKEFENQEMNRFIAGLKNLKPETIKKLGSSISSMQKKSTSYDSKVNPRSSISSLSRKTQKIPTNKISAHPITQIVEEPEELDSPTNSFAPTENKNKNGIKDIHDMSFPNFKVNGKSTDNLDLNNLDQTELIEIGNSKPEEEDLNEHNPMNILLNSEQNDFKAKQIISSVNSNTLFSQMTDIRGGESKLKSKINVEFKNVMEGKWEGTDRTIQSMLQEINNQKSERKIPKSLRDIVSNHVQNMEKEKFSILLKNLCYIENNPTQNIEEVLNNNILQMNQFEFSGNIKKEDLSMNPNQLLSVAPQQQFEQTNQTFNLQHNDLLSEGGRTFNNTNRTDFKDLLSEINSKKSSQFQFSINSKASSLKKQSDLIQSLNNDHSVNTIKKEQGRPSTIDEVDEGAYFTGYDTNNPNRPSKRVSNTVSVNLSKNQPLLNSYQPNQDETIQHTFLLDKTDPYARSTNILSYDLGPEKTFLNMTKNENIIPEEKEEELKENFKDLNESGQNKESEREDFNKIDSGIKNSENFSLIHNLNINKTNDDIRYDIGDNDGVNMTLMSGIQTGLSSFNGNKGNFNFMNSEVSHHQDKDSQIGMGNGSSNLNSIIKNDSWGVSHQNQMSEIRLHDPRASEMMVQFSGVDSFIAAGKNNLSYKQPEEKQLKINESESEYEDEDENQEEDDDEEEDENNESEYNDSNYASPDNLENSQYKVDKEDQEFHENLEDGPDLDKIEYHIQGQKNAYQLTDSSINMGVMTSNTHNFSMMDNSNVINNKVIQNNKDESSFNFESRFGNKDLANLGLLSRNSSMADNIIKQHDFSINKDTTLDFSRNEDTILFNNTNNILSNNENAETTRKIEDFNPNEISYRRSNTNGSNAPFIPDKTSNKPTIKSFSNTNDLLTKFKNVKLKNEKILRKISEKEENDIFKLKKDLREVIDDYEFFFQDMLSNMNRITSNENIYSKWRKEAEKNLENKRYKIIEMEEEKKILKRDINDMYEVFRIYVYSKKEQDIGNPNAVLNLKVNAIENYFKIKLNKFTIKKKKNIDQIKKSSESSEYLSANTLKKRENFANNLNNITGNSDSRYNSRLNLSKQESFSLNCSNYKNNLKFFNTRMNKKDDPENSVFFDMITKKKEGINETFNTGNKIDQIISDNNDFNVLNSYAQQDKMISNKFGSINTTSPNYGAYLSVHFENNKEENVITDSNVNFENVSGIKTTHNQSELDNRCDSELRIYQKNIKRLESRNESDNSEYDSEDDNNDEEQSYDSNASIVRVKTIENLEVINQLNLKKSQRDIQKIESEQNSEKANIIDSQKENTINHHIDMDDDHKVTMSDTFNLTLDFGKNNMSNLKNNKKNESQTSINSLKEENEDFKNDVEIEDFPKYDSEKSEENVDSAKNNEDLPESNLPIGSSSLTQTMTTNLNSTGNFRRGPEFSELTNNIMNMKNSSAVKLNDESFNVMNDFNFESNNQEKSELSLDKIEEAMKEISVREVEVVLQADSQFVKIGDEMIKTNQEIKVKEIMQNEENETIEEEENIDFEKKEVDIISLKKSNHSGLSAEEKEDAFPIEDLPQNKDNTNPVSVRTASTKDFLKRLSTFNEQFREDKTKEILESNVKIDHYPVTSKSHIFKNECYEKSLLDEMDKYMTNEKIINKSLPSKRELDLLIKKDNIYNDSDNSFEKNENELKIFSKKKDQNEIASNIIDIIDGTDNTIIHNNSKKFGKTIDIIKRIPKKSVTRLRNRNSKEQSSFIGKNNPKTNKKNNIIFQKLYSKKAVNEKTKPIIPTRNKSGNLRKNDSKPKSKLKEKFNSENQGLEEINIKHFATQLDKNEMNSPSNNITNSKFFNLFQISELRKINLLLPKEMNQFIKV